MWVESTETDFGDGLVSSVTIAGTGDAAYVRISTVQATGGTITYSGGYTIHTFTSDGTFTPPVAMNVEVLVVAGGGSGSIDHGGGGGGGGIAYHISYAVPAGNYAVVVGAGGTAGYGSHITGSQGGGTARSYPNSNSGANSSFNNVIIAYGGGGAGSFGGTAGSNGGSGGGGGATGSVAGGTATQGTGGTSYWGNAGGGGSGTANYGAGGGGAGGGGTSQTTGTAGNGARPVTWADAYGTNTSNAVGGGYFSGGGAGGSHTLNAVTNQVSQGYGGGGGFNPNIGNYSTNQYVGANGMANTGGGGSGIGNPGDSSNPYAGNGGSGIVIVRYLNYFSTGTYKSNVLDCGAKVVVSSVGWTPASQPGGSSVNVGLRVSSASFSAGSATPDWVTVTNGQTVNWAGRYIQYMSTFTTTSSTTTPRIEDITIVYKVKPWQEKTTVRTGKNSYGFGGGENWEWEIPTKSGQQVTITAYIRYNANYGSASKPKLTLYNLGIINNSQMTAGADTWEQLTMSGTPNRNGVLKLKIEGYSTVPGAKMYVDDINISQ
ncbi:MAG: glycine-rich domain-containing protein [Elusimicrobiota bacterium]